MRQRLIDANALWESAETCRETTGAFQALIESAPTVDAVQVVHGEWHDEQRGRWIYAKCNLCGNVQDVRSNYCPNCGARMDGENDAID